MKIRAAILERRGGSFRVDEADLAEPAHGEVRIKIEACGVCRSDLHAIDGGEDVGFPAVLGHEAAGVVDGCGPAVSNLKVGDRVILSWTPACGRCPSCARSEPNLCAGITMSTGGAGPLTWNGRGVDRFMALGAFSEYVVVPEAMAIAIESRIPADQACLIGCAVMTGYGAAVGTARVQGGETVAVIGCGAVGLAAVQGARIAGASRIIAIDPIESRRDCARRVGATDAFAPEEGLGGVGTLTHDGVDVAVECVGAPVTMQCAFSVIRPGGRAVVVGLPELGSRLEIDPLPLLFEKSIRGSMYGSAVPARDFPRLVSLSEDGAFDLAALVADTVPLAEINRAVAMTRERPRGRIVVTP